MISDRELGSLPGRIAGARAGRHEVVEAAAQFGHGRVDREHIFCCDSTQRHNSLWLDRGDLPHQKWGTRFTLIALGSAISGRTAFHDICNVNVFAAYSHCLDHVVEELTGAAHEGLALSVFVGTGTFSNE